MNALARILAKSGLLTKDLDYHLLRAAMVLIFLAFGYQKWFAYEVQILIPLHQQWPADFLALSRFRPPRGQLVSRRFRMDVWRAAVPGILEQATGNSGSHRLDAHFPRDGHDHSVHAEWLGCSRRRFSRDVRQCSFSHEGRRASCCIVLFAEAGCRQVDSFSRTHRRRELPDQDFRKGDGPLQSS